MPAPPDLPSLLAAIRSEPEAEPRWLALAAFLWNNGLDDDAAVVRVFWPAIRDSLANGRSLESALRLVHAHAGRLGRRARGIEELAARSPAGQ
jgi:hypothetical protein